MCKAKFIPILPYVFCSLQASSADCFLHVEDVRRSVTKIMLIQKNVNSIMLLCLIDRCGGGLSAENQQSAAPVASTVAALLQKIHSLKLGIGTKVDLTQQIQIKVY